MRGFRSILPLLGALGLLILLLVCGAISLDRDGYRHTTANDSPAFPQIDGLDVDDGLKRFGGKTDFYRRMLRMFADRHGNDPRLLAELLAAGDLAELKRSAHNLKGAAGSLGARAVHDVADALRWRFTVSQRRRKLINCATA